MRAVGRWIGPTLAMIAALHAIPAVAETPREMLVQAAFSDRNVAVALDHVDRAQRVATVQLQQAPDDQEAATIHATATGYRAKLTGSRTEALAARRQFESLVARYPRNPEAQAALGAWHIGVIVKVGRLVGRIAGAQKPIGLAALDRAVALGGNRAMFLGLAGLLRLELDYTDPQGRALVEAAARGATPTPIDMLLRRAATAVLVPLRKGNGAETQALATRLLPFGLIAIS